MKNEGLTDCHTLFPQDPAGQVTDVCPSEGPMSIYTYLSKDLDLILYKIKYE